MNEDYNSILKEKKVYKDPVVSHEHRFFKLSIFLGIILSFIMIGIVYMVYYNTILDSESVMLNNVSKIITRYEVIYKNLFPNYDFSGNYELSGDVGLGNIGYNYSFVKDNGKIKRSFSNNVNGKSVNYYYDGDLGYMNYGDISSVMDEKLQLNDYYVKDIDKIKNNFNGYVNDLFFNSSCYEMFNRIYNMNNIGNVVEEIKTNFTTYVSSDKYIKRFYFEGKLPIVEVNLVLNTKDINNILKGSSFKVSDDYEVSITMKNDALSDEIKSIKVVINDKTDNVRSVIDYDGKDIIYSDSEGNSGKIILEIKKKGYELKIYNNEVLYGVLSNLHEENKDTYTYLVIDKVYNVTLTVDRSEAVYNYVLETNIDNNTNNLNIDVSYSKIGKIEDNFDGSKVSDNNINFFDKSIKDVLFS